MSIFELWIFVTVIPGIATVFGFLSIILPLAIGGLLFYSCMQRALSRTCPELQSSKMEAVAATEGFRIMRKLIPYAIICAVAASILPSERQMLLIAGGYTATNNAEIKKLPTNAAKAVNAWLDAVSEAGSEPSKTK